MNPMFFTSLDTSMYVDYGKFELLGWSKSEGVASLSKRGHPGERNIGPKMTETGYALSG